MKKFSWKKIPWKKVFNALIFIFSACLIIYFCISPDGLIALLKSSTKLNPVWLLPALGCHFANLAIDAWLMYKFICNSSGKIKFGRAFRVAMTGQFFNSVTPGGSGGQPMQILLMRQYGISVGEGLSALTQKFVVWQFTTVGYCLVLFLIKFDFISNLSTWLKTAGAIGFAMQAWLLFLLLMVSFADKLVLKIVSAVLRFLSKIKLIKNPDQIIEKTERQLALFHDSNKKITGDKKFLVQIYSVSIVHVTVNYLVTYFIYKTFGLNGTGVVDIICAQAFVSIISMLVPSPGGSGAAELCFAGFFGGLFSKETLQSAIIFWRTISYYLTIAVSAPFAGFAKDKTKNLEDIDENVES